VRAEGIDIGFIGKQLGRRSVATTARCRDHIAAHAAAVATRERRWAGDSI